MAQGCIFFKGFPSIFKFCPPTYVLFVLGLNILFFFMWTLAESFSDLILVPRKKNIFSIYAVFRTLLDPSMDATWLYNGPTMALSEPCYFLTFYRLYIHFQALFGCWKTCFALVLLNIWRDAKDKRADSHKVITKLGSKGQGTWN